MHIPGLTELLSHSALFASLPESALQMIGSQSTLLFFRLGDVIIRGGESSDGLYFIYSGKIRVLDDAPNSPAVTVAILEKGEGFGEQALLHKRPPSHTVRAASDVTLLKLSTETFDRLIREHPGLAEQLEKGIQQNTEFNFLRKLGLLSHLTLDRVRELQKQLATVRLEAGGVLFKQGDQGKSCYVVREGRLRILREAEGRQVRLAVVKPGQLIGEMSLLYGQRRSASAVAVGDAEVLCLSKELFDRFFDTEAAQDVIVQQATDRLLQNETLLTEDVPAAAPQVKARLSVVGTRPEGGWFSREYPFVAAGSPVLAGVACLKMIDNFHRPRDPDQRTLEQELEQQLPESTSDTIHTLSYKAESRGYLTRMLHLDNCNLGAAALPAIVELDGGSLAVVCAVSNRRVILADPLDGISSVRRAEFESSWNGRILELNNIPNLGSVKNRTTQIARRFAPIFRPYLRLLVAIAALSLMVQLFGLANPLFSQAIIDEVLVSGDRSLLQLMLLGILIVTVFRMCASSLRVFLVAHVARRISVGLQLRFFQHILSLPQKTASAWRVGAYLVRFGENEKLLNLVANTGARLLIDSTTVLVSFAVMYSMNAELTLIAAIFIVALAALMLMSSPRLRAARRRVFAKSEAATSHVVEVATGIQTIKALAAEDAVFDRGHDLIAAQKLEELKSARLTFNLGLVSTALSKAATFVILGYGATLALVGDLTTGQLVAFNAILGLTLAPLLSLVGVCDELAEIRICFERVGEVLKQEVEEQPKNAMTSAIQGHVLLENVSFRYSDDQENVLDNINLEVLPGQKIAIVGRSGSGKTTLTSLLLNLYKPTAGRVLLDHVAINNIPTSHLRRQFGVVEQQPFLFSGTIHENIAKADPSAGLERVVAAATLAGAHKLIEQLPMGYDTQIGERGMTLSGGQRQRLVIARALLGNPRILILDEATSALDVESERIIQKNLDGLIEGRTVFVIAHRLSTVRNADVIIVMDKGRIVEQGTHAQLMSSRGLYFYLNSATA